MRKNLITLAIIASTGLLVGCEPQVGDNIKLGLNDIQVKDVYKSKEDCEKDWNKYCAFASKEELNKEIVTDVNNLVEEAKKIEENQTASVSSSASTSGSHFNPLFLPYFWTSPYYSMSDRSYNGFAPQSNSAVRQFNNRTGIVKNPTITKLYSDGKMSNLKVTPQNVSKLSTPAFSSPKSSVSRGGFGGRGSSGG